jgi:hypothetical protein
VTVETEPPGMTGTRSAAGLGDAPAASVPTAVEHAPSAPPVSSAEYSVAFSPRNVALGLAIVAGLVALVARRRRARDNSAEAG